MRINPQNKQFIISIIIQIVSIAGILLSILLIFEYFGLTFSVTDAVCNSSESGLNPCAIVSASRFSAVRGLPLIGDLPIAVFGFIFYGFIAVLIFMFGSRRKSEDIHLLHVIILSLSSVAFLCAIALYMISVFIIRLVCPLCIMTYAVTAIILISSIVALNNNSQLIKNTLFIKLKDFLKKQMLGFVIIALVLIFAGLGVKTGAYFLAKSQGLAASSDRLKQAIKRYESAGETAISIKGVPVAGNVNAKTKIVIFFDFTCIHCRIEFLFLDQIINKYPNKISVAFKFYPLYGKCELQPNTTGSNKHKLEACNAFISASCASHQGKFIDYAKTIFDDYHIKKIGFPVTSLREAARVNGLNVEEFDRCSSANDLREFINNQYEEAEKIGIKSTPVLFLNGRKLDSESRKADVLEGLVQYCIKKAGN